MVGSDSRDLTRAEQSYVAQVKYQLRHEPRERQHAMLNTVRRVLLSSAPYDGYPRIERELGTPAEYAARLQGRGDTAHDVVSRPAAARTRSATAWLWVLFAVVVVIVAVVAIVLATR